MLQIKEIINSSISVKQAIFNDDNLIELIAKVANVISNSLANGNKIMLCGNGGSAADAQHIAAEFTGRFYKEREALRVEALHCNTSYLTAVANDYGFDQVYSRLINGIGNEGDILIGLSTSGNSKNIFQAMYAAQKINMLTIGMTGEDGGIISEFSDYLIKVPSKVTARIQESHIMIGHILCKIVEDTLIWG